MSPQRLPGAFPPRSIPHTLPTPHTLCPAVGLRVTIVRCSSLPDQEGALPGAICHGTLSLTALESLRVCGKSREGQKLEVNRNRYTLHRILFEMRYLLIIWKARRSQGCQVHSRPCPNPTPYPHPTPFAREWVEG